MDVGDESLCWFMRLNRLWESLGDLEIFTVASDASSPSSSLSKDADAFREEVQLELDSILGTQGGTCSRNLQTWRRSLCTEAVLPVNVPSHQISANLFSSEDTSGLGGGVQLAEGNKKEQGHLALTKWGQTSIHPVSVCWGTCWCSQNRTWSTCAWGNICGTRLWIFLFRNTFKNMIEFFLKGGTQGVL